MLTSKVRGVTIRVFLVDGTPEGLRLVDRPGWTGSFLAFSRADYPSARLRDETARTGTYVLAGPDPDGKRAQRIYVGEGEVIRKRLDDHQNEKDFWTHGYVLTTSNDSFNKAHGRYLEARLLQLALAADKATPDNGTAPQPPALVEQEVAEMESYLDSAVPLFSLVGLTVFEASESESTAATEGLTSGNQAPDLTGTRLELKTSNVDAEAEDQPKGFLVFQGALGRKETKVMIPGYEAQREQLLAEGILVEKGADRVMLTKDHLFDSPSAAVSILIGGNRNGRTEWKQKGSTKTLKELQSETTALPVLTEQTE